MSTPTCSTVRQAEPPPCGAGLELDGDELDELELELGPPVIFAVKVRRS